MVHRFDSQKINNAYAIYLEKAHKSVKQCIEDYESGKGSKAYHQHQARVEQAHRDYMETVTGDPYYDQRK